MQNKIPRLFQWNAACFEIFSAPHPGDPTQVWKCQESRADPRVVTIFICCKNNFKVGKSVLTTWCFPVRPKCRLWLGSASLPYDATLHHTRYDASVWILSYNANTQWLKSHYQETQHHRRRQKHRARTPILDCTGKTFLFMYKSQKLQ